MQALYAWLRLLIYTQLNKTKRVEAGVEPNLRSNRVCDRAKVYDTFCSLENTSERINVSMVMSPGILKCVPEVSMLRNGMKRMIEYSKTAANRERWQGNGLKKKAIDNSAQKGIVIWFRRNT